MEARTSLVVLLCLAAANARVTFEKAEVIDHGDLKTTKKVAFQCPRECRVYTPTSTDYLRIVDDSDKLITSFTDLFKTPVKGPLELKGGNFSVINSAEGNPDFMLYIVQKDADNYNSPVYNTLQKVDASNQRFVTMISDTQGFRKFNTTLYTVGADSVAKCRPVFTALSRDNAERTSFTISGPICTVDFGADQGTHVVTFGNDLNTQPSTAIGTSTVIVSPGHVGCAITGDQLYTNENTKNKDLPPYTVNIEDGSLPLKVFAEYSIQSLDAALEINVNNLTMRWADTGLFSKDFEGTSFKVGVKWTRPSINDVSRFAIQIDNAVKTSSSCTLSILLSALIITCYSLI